MVDGASLLMRSFVVQSAPALPTGLKLPGEVPEGSVECSNDDEVCVCWVLGVLHACNGTNPAPPPPPFTLEVGVGRTPNAHLAQVVTSKPCSLAPHSPPPPRFFWTHWGGFHGFTPCILNPTRD